MFIALWPLVIAVIGALVYAFAKDKPAQLGLVLFAVGALWTVYALAGKTLELG
jgi:chromate transport protein ChrA